jgi:hypothetical protein
VILLDDVIEIRNNATAASSTKRALLFKLLNNSWVGRIPIQIDYARPRMPGSGKCLLEEAPSTSESRLSESNALATFHHRGLNRWMKLDRHIREAIELP